MNARIRIKRGDNELELEGEPSFIAEQFERMKALAFGESPAAATPKEAIAESPFPPVSASYRVKKNLSFDDFLSLKEPQSPVDRLVCLAYFQEKYGERVQYSVPELEAFWQASWPESPLEEHVWKEAIEQGLLQWQEEGRLTLSYSGHNYVRDGLA